MPEKILTEVFTGGTQDATTLTLTKSSLVEPTATNKFVPATSNTTESMLAGMCQVLAVKFPERTYSDDVTNNLQVTASEPTVSTSGGVTYSETVFTFTFQRVLDTAELAGIALKPSAM